MSLAAWLQSSTCVACGATEQLSKNGLSWFKNSRKHTSGAEARIDLIRFSPGMKSPAYHPGEFFAKL
jgi:hypothetical protein